VNKYIVSIPIAGAIHIAVEANSEREAKEAAWKKVDDGEAGEDIEWEFLDAITTGNVCHAPLNEILVDEVRE
jgi:hypothetical protein